MTTQDAPRDSNGKKKRTRRKRARTIPAQIEKSQSHELAKRRLLMMLEVLSGRMSVTAAIEKTQISRNTYYQLESKALNAMLEALTPFETPRGRKADPRKKLRALEDRIERLEVENRRLERLLALNDRYLKPGSVTTGLGRKPKRKTISSPRSKKISSRASAGDGDSASTSTTTTKRARKTKTSTPIVDGADGSCDGNAS